MRRIAEFVLNHRKLVLIGWLLVVVAGIALTGRTNDRLVIDFSLPGQPGTETANQIDEEFKAGGKTAPYVVSVTMPAGQVVTGQEAAVGRAFAAVQQEVPQTRVIDEANTGDKAFRTGDDRTAYALVFYRFMHDPTAPFPTDAITEALTAAAPTGATVGVTGEDALAIGDAEGGGASVLIEVLFGALGALVVLAFVFASFLAFLPLVVAAVSILTTFILLLPLTYLTDVSFIVEFLIALIGLGVAIDYSLILVTRWREERDHGRDNHEAVVVAMQTAGHAVMFSGITVAIGLLALVVLPVPFMRSIGLGGALIPLASVLTTLTLTPAILGGIGPKVDWPKIRHENRAGKAWTRWARGVVRHRILSTGVALLALGLLVAAFFGIKIGLASSSSLAKNGPAYTAFETLKAGGVPTGVLTPMEVLVDTPRAESVAAALRDVPGVDRAVVATGDGQSVNGHSIVVVIPDSETVNSSSIQPVRDVKEVVADLPGVVGVAGIGADQIDFLKAVYGNFPLMLTIIALLTFILLVRAFRSILLPIKAILLNLVTLGATLGFMVLFWQNGFGSDTIFGVDETGAVTFWLPLMVFAFLFGLSMDYEVFILARVREEYDRTGNTDDAVVEGIGRTGRLVTSAALILFLAFLALATGPGTDLKTFATALGFGILLDATIVRSVLVPALVSLFGQWNWWLPDWVARVLRIPPSRPIEPAVVGDAVAVPEPRGSSSPSSVSE
ncbi:MMPL family transporter [Frankia sp. CNm7]|uniref:MMPL family transporter n=1 Tax=Frankia nepalensis TaxID=1836974 RepID=A0A937UTF6_9ACTN|nr:MMPL family transporter [Frankia nepalensis]MBL7500784.1 MMPL family transporter [Frankia nepalensis]MBL7515544.1 MMPL family transporter [Frankia nepalensis]MBL7519585.1 MMPL family transporter [Frankia nepalensis]MBL7633527.1 MMPL family transporter [Frankia nepalensis]